MNYILVSSLNNQIQIMDIINEEEVQRFNGHLNSNYLVDVELFSGNNKHIIISGSEDGNICLWDMENPSEPHRLPSDMLNNPEGNIVNCLDINKAGLMATSCFPYSDNSINLIQM